jgi:hypothetical protein
MKLLQKNALSKAILLAMTASMLVACGGEDGSDGADGVNGTDGVAGDSAPVVDTVDDTVSGVSAIDLTSIVFTGVSAPVTDAEKRTVTASEVTIDGEVYGGAYKTLVRSGEDVNGIYFGQLVDESGTVLKSEDGEIEISDSNEFTSLLPIGDKLFSVSQFESRPGAMFLM